MAREIASTKAIYERSKKKDWKHGRPWIKRMMLIFYINLNYEVNKYVPPKNGQQH